MDEFLAKHVTYVHKKGTYPTMSFDPFDPGLIRAYINKAKTFKPKIPRDLHNLIVQKYVEKRKMQNVADKAGYMYITPRTLLGIIRLSQAMAKLRNSIKVDQNDIEEAIRLMKISRSTIGDEADEKVGTQKTDKMSAIFDIIRECFSTRGEMTIKKSEIEKMVIAKGGYTIEDLEEVLKQYVGLNVLYMNESRTEITFA